MTSATRLSGPLAAAALVAAPAGCVFDEASSLHRDSTVKTEVRAGDVTCRAAGYPDAVSLTIAPAASGTVTHERGLTITLETDGASFDFSASQGVDAVIARDGRSATIYHYAPPALGDAALAGPLNSSQGGPPHELTEVSFCRAALGCTLAADYWRNSSGYGPAAYDDAWARLPSGADTPFFLSGQSYYDALWTRGGGAYYGLAHAYIAVELSRLAGAGSDVIAHAFADATEILEAYTPEEIEALPSSSELRAQIVGLAGVLADYARGDVGPGRCDEAPGGVISR